MIESPHVRVETELLRFYETGRRRADGFGGHYPALWDALERAGRGGKRTRPTLVLTAYRGLGGEDEALASMVAAAFEMLHTAFLLHDDVIDHDLRRRGVLNVGGVFVELARARGADERQADTWASSAGILAGDLVLSHAHRLLGTLDVSTAMRTELLDIVDDAVFASAAGELADVTNALAGDSLAVEDVIATLAAKTAVYSFQTPLEAGAVLAGAGTDIRTALRQIGERLGIAFQLADDLLGVFGDEALTGKSTLADLREGKVTTLIAHARGTSAWERLSALVGDPDLDEAGAAEARLLLERCGARAETERLARGHASAACDLARDAAFPPELARALALVADAATERTR
jgi:geranylgeranyl diphosphate synthase, type II